MLWRLWNNAMGIEGFDGIVPVKDVFHINCFTYPGDSKHALQVG